MRDIFTASAASPLVEAAPATISPMVAKQNGHIVHLSGGKASTAPSRSRLGKIFQTHDTINRAATERERFRLQLFQQPPIPVTSTKGAFRQSLRKKLPAVLEKELSHRGVLRQADRAIEGLRRLMRSPQPPQQMSANRPVGLIVRNVPLVDRIQYCQPGFRPTRFGGRCGVAGSCANRRRYANQLFVKHYDRRPLRPAASRSLSMYRLNRGFKLKAPGAAVR